MEGGIFWKKLVHKGICHAVVPIVYVLLNAYSQVPNTLKSLIIMLIECFKKFWNFYLALLETVRLIILEKKSAYMVIFSDFLQFSVLKHVIFEALNS